MAGKTSSERVSVKGYLIPYLKEVGSYIGTDDLSEVVNHIITCNKLGCTATGSQSTTAQPHSPVSLNTFSSMTNTPVDDVSLADSLGDLFAA